MEKVKKILIVDDSEIDREILKSILEDDFEILEAENGYIALQLMVQKKQGIDAILLDVSMPFIDGFEVLRILRENNLDDMHIFMISAEATKENIEKASQYNIDQFIKKPFEREEVLKRVKEKLDIEKKTGLTRADMDSIRVYISDLEAFYSQLLKFSGKGSAHAKRRVGLMRILLEEYPLIEKETEHDAFYIEMLCKAAYFCDIGNVMMQDMIGEGAEKQREDSEIYRQHTVLGADLIRLNYAERCANFVQVCSEMCRHHHERYDGKGYPDGLSGKEIPVYTQMCALLDRFDDLFIKYSRHNEVQFDYVIHQLQSDEGFVSDEVFSLLVESKPDIINYYNSHYLLINEDS